MNDSRQAIRAIVRGEPTRPVIAPLWDGIFAASVLGKRYASEVTLDEKLAVAELCGFDPILPLDPGLLWAKVESVQMQSSTEQHEEMRRATATLRSPFGSIRLISEEPTCTTGTCIQDATDSPHIYDVIEWYYQEIMNHRSLMLDEARSLAHRYGDRACLCLGWMTPVELCFMAYPNIITMYLDHTERHHEMMELHMDFIRMLIEIAAEAGWDAYYTAGPPIELVGMKMYEEVAVPYLIRIRETAHEAGLWFRLHNCGHIRRLLESGTYNRIRPDLFETLAPPPMGELEDLRWARQQLDADICTRGNMDLEFLKTATPKEVARRSAEILKETDGYRHIVGTADEILAGTPVENVRAVVEGTLNAS